MQRHSKRKRHTAPDSRDEASSSRTVNINKVISSNAVKSLGWLTASQFEDVPAAAQHFDRLGQRQTAECVLLLTNSQKHEQWAGGCEYYI